jgi:ubiquinone/menaquinone biosynthesis C-methylase UbiE
MHGLAEATGLPDGSFDASMMTFLMHELPSDITRAILAEHFRVLAPGGVIAITGSSVAASWSRRG